MTWQQEIVFVLGIFPYGYKRKYIDSIDGHQKKQEATGIDNKGKGQKKKIKARKK